MGRRLLLKAGRDQLVPRLTLLSHYTLYKERPCQCHLTRFFFPANFFLANTAALCGGGDGRCYCFVGDFYEGRFTYRPL